jgi:hypothetical protein
MISGKVLSQDGLISVEINGGCDDESLKALMETNASLLLNAFNTAAKERKKPKIQGGMMTTTTRIKVGELWKTSPMKCTENVIKTSCQSAVSGDYEIRNIPVTMLSADSVETMNEEIALSFNEQGQINDLNITVKAPVPDTARFIPQDIVNYDKIRDFIEKFRTAYNCKDIEYLENVYSDNAIIINVVKKTIRQVPNTDQPIRNIISDKYNYEFQVRTKTQYFTKLRQVFKKNRYINIVFDDIEIEPHPGIYNIYGVTLKQHWNASEFNDVGFLYLLIDCRKEYEMEIYVRAWSEEKIFDFTYFNEYRFMQHFDNNN